MPTRRLQKSSNYDGFEFGWLVGFFLAEGSFRKVPGLTSRGQAIRSNEIAFSVHTNEAPLVAQILFDYAHKRWPSTGGIRGARYPRIVQDKRGKSATVLYACRALRSKMEKYVVEGAGYSQKWLKELPPQPSFADGILRGWLAGDGTNYSIEVSRDRDRPISPHRAARVSVEASSVCLNLAWQMRQIALDLGLKVGFSDSIQSEGAKGAGNQIFNLSINPKADPRYWEWQRGFGIPEHFHTGESLEARSGLLCKTGLNDKDYNGYVYDLTVDNGHVYVANGVLAHNSTFHNAVGSFADLIDEHEQMGYKLYRWSIFDVAERCTSCVNVCQSPEPCFREDHVEKVTDPETGEDKDQLVHKAYSFLGQEIVFVRDPKGNVESTTLQELYGRFATSGKRVAAVPLGWEIFDTVTPPARWSSNIVWTPLLRVSRHRPQVALRTIQTGSGDCITVTDDHPFLLMDRKEPFFVPASTVALGDNCCVPDVVKHLATEEVEFDYHLAYLIGLYLAEGNMGINARGSKWVVLSGMVDPERAAKEAAACGLNVRVRPHSAAGWNVLFGADFYDILRGLGLKHEVALTKRMPNNFINWSRDSIADMLCGLIDGDGTIHHSRGNDIYNDTSSVCIRVISKALVSQALLCLRKLGMSGWSNYVGFYHSIYNQNDPLYRLEFSISSDKLDLFGMSEKISNGMWLRTRGYPRVVSSDQKKVRSIKEAELGSHEFVYDVTTQSQTFWCSGFRTHNCAGQALYSDGWIPMEEIHLMWARMNRSHETWEVEAMGSRPATSGYVIKDHIKFSRNITVQTGPELYLPGGPISVVVDWGTIAAGVEVWQAQVGSKHVLLHADLLEHSGVDTILGKILSRYHQYIDDFVEVAADIGGGGNYLNKKLREDFRIPCRDVNFNMEKEAAVAAWNVYNESGSIIIPAEHEVFIKQTKRWRRNAAGQIIKRNDHLCDAAICYFSKFIEDLGLTNIRVMPRTFNTGAPPKRDMRHEEAGPASGRVAIIRTLGGRKKR